MLNNRKTIRRTKKLALKNILNILKIFKLKIKNFNFNFKLKLITVNEISELKQHSN